MSDERTPTAEPVTEAGRALLRSDFDTTGWGPRVVRQHVTQAILAIEAEAAQRSTAEPVTEADTLYIRGLKEGARQAVADRDAAWRADVDDLAVLRQAVADHDEEEVKRLQALVAPVAAWPCRREESDECASHAAEWPYPNEVCEWMIEARQALDRSADDDTEWICDVGPVK